MIDFSRFFKVERPNYAGNTLFPNMKTQSLTASYERLCDGATIPTIAQVHALDAEANIGTRPSFTKVELEKLYIKEKINLGERERLLLKGGVSAPSEIMNFIYNDIARLSESVLARMELAKMEAFSTGKMTVKENNLNFTVDYKVPSENFETKNWATASHDILGDIRKWVDLLADKGVVVNYAYTSRKIVNILLQNEAIQKAINGAPKAGVLLTLTQLNGLFSEHFGFTILVDNNAVYQYQKANGSLESKKFFDVNKFILFQSVNGAVGTGLWGATPEEDDYSPFDSAISDAYITSVTWSTPDPVTTWTKAAGLMIPVIPNPNALFIATVATGA